MKTIYKAVLGILVIVVIGAIVNKTAKAASACYPSSGTCLTQAQGHIRLSMVAAVLGRLP